MIDGFIGNDEKSNHQSETVSTNPFTPNIMLTGSTSDAISTPEIDPYLIATILARAENVAEVYVLKSEIEGQLDVWTIVSDDSSEALRAVFDQELALQDYIGRQLASVEFHVVGPEAKVGLDMDDRIYSRGR